MNLRIFCGIMFKKILFLFVVAAGLLRADETPLVQATMVAANKVVKPGDAFDVAIQLQIADGWHIYSQNLQAVGSPTVFTWSLPSGIHLLSLDWPASQMFDAEGVKYDGYEKNPLWIAHFATDSSLSMGSEMVKLDLSWVACKIACVPGAVTTSLPIQIGSESLINEDALPLLAQAKFGLSKEGTAEAKEASVQTVQEFAVQEFAVQEFAPQQITPMMPMGSAQSVLLIAFLAFIGGIILNIMPCVLPIIGIKVLHIVQMKGEGRLRTFKLGLSFTLGVLVSFWVLAGIIFGLQRAGTVVGWGFQLQEPLFVTIMLIILFLFALSLFGLFEIGTGISSYAAEAQATGKKHGSNFASFLSGVLTTMIACPCTGPLLGTVLGFSATLEWHTGLLVFTSLGIGVAFPFLFLSLFPELSVVLPRPGAWMATFKQFLGFCMLATVLWLVWVLNAQVGPLDLTYLLGLFFVIAIGGWIWGTWGTPVRNRFTRFLAALLAILFVVGPSYSLIQRVRLGSGFRQVQAPSGPWKPYSEEAVSQALREGKTVFVDYTAKWCLTCQTNKLALHSKKVMDAFAKANVELFLADWTKNDPLITKALRDLGRNSVPVYALYPKGASKPILLPEILTPDIVVDAIDTH